MSRSLAIPRLVVAGKSSGVGKTTVMVGLCRALRQRGLDVAVFKCGPDYLDPTYHSQAAGIPSHALDGWMMGKDAVLNTFASSTADADIALIEGVMGLFDGATPASDEGSTAQIAKWLRSPVALVVDVSGMARSVAALAHGFAHFDPDLQLGALLCNNVGSRGHLDLLRTALKDPPVLGGLPEQPTLRFPERHLGLQTATESPISESVFDQWGKLMEEWVDVDSILTLAHDAPLLELPAAGNTPERLTTQTSESRVCRIGYAYDAAFHFYYEDNLRRLRDLGVELVPFSPLTDVTLPSVEGIYLGGGYPEVYAEALSANESLREAIVRFAGQGYPIYAECGGLMYLCSAIKTLDGCSYPMVGLIPAEAVMHD